MMFEKRYLAGKQALLADDSICARNRELFAKFFDRLEYKLKRRNGLARLDEHSYRTLDGYVTRLRTVNRWFNNKSWQQLTRDDIQRVYDDLEDGRIVGVRTGQPIRDRVGYYKKIFRGEPFALAGKRDLARAVLEFYRPAPSEQVRFIREDEFRRLIDVTREPVHRLLLWLCFDIGENVSSILALRKLDCRRQINPDTNEPEYVVNLRREILKRTRRARSELTNYPETIRLIDQLSQNRTDTEPLFAFGHRYAAEILTRAVKATGVRCIPDGQNVTLKDLRSSMACDLLNKGWTTDEVNARLGHAPGSPEIKKYINFLAIDRHRPKQKVQEFQVKRLLEELEKFRQRERLLTQRQETLRFEYDAMKAKLAEFETRRDQDRRAIHAEVRRLLKPRRAS